MKLTVADNFPAPPMFAREMRRADKNLKPPDTFYEITEKGKQWLTARATEIPGDA
ncbi:hypothetical protein F406_gp042 [Agrobacterium phage 7-7-1]|uniref:Uncharacterized protein n=1 Tax=Agrobacterium phage 7-7-1 TaxID=1161931 RepID=J7FAR5_9CAUD|nr:hypothetical protein F406_gp042 [Agrobacterium phage 7-7-1]AFH19773.1 hypothetical protein 7-7-1_00075 [Agrobacterium phage 7-7-1]